MYIPITFFGSQGACLQISTSTISGSGTIITGSFLSGGVYWDYYQFRMTNTNDATLTPFTASFNVLSGSTSQAKLLVVGGGGTGANQNSFTIPNGQFTYTVDSAGGGGGGGVVYYDQFPLSPGTYEIGVASATAGAGAQGQGIVGKDSYVKLPNNITYPAFTTPFIRAFGGGAGGKEGLYFQISPQQRFFELIPAGDGGSGGGAGQHYRGGSDAGGSPLRPNGINNGFQGNKGGDAPDNFPNASYSTAGGGGGAGAPGGTPTIPLGGPSGSVGAGGIGLSFNLTGSAIVVGGGGGGTYLNASGVNNGGNFGGGGDAFKDNGTSNTPNGRGGVVIIAVPRCESSFTCREFAITGSGAVASFLECNNTIPTSTTLANNFDIVACLKTFSGSITPLVATGATYRALSGSCNTAFTSSNDGCVNCNTYRVTSDTNKIAKVTYTPCNETTSSVTYINGTFDLCVSGSGITAETGSAISLGTNCSVIGCDTSPSNTNTPPCPCQQLRVSVYRGRYDFDYTDCNGVTQRRSSGQFPFCGVPGSIRNGSCAIPSCIGLSISQGGPCCTYP